MGGSGYSKHTYFLRLMFFFFFLFCFVVFFLFFFVVVFFFFFSFSDLFLIDIYITLVSSA